MNFDIQAHVFVHKLYKWAKYHAVVFRQKNKDLQSIFCFILSVFITSVTKQHLYDTLCSLTFSADFKNPGNLSFNCLSTKEFRILPLVKKGKLNLD